MKQITTFIIGLSFLLSLVGFADPGKEEIGKLKACLYLGTDDSSTTAGDNAKKATTQQVKSLASNKNFKFSHYFLLGEDTASVLRSYENWVTPLKKSEAMMLSFEPVGNADVKNKKIMLDMDLWQKRKKIMKKAHTLTVGKPLLIRGPKWRGGYLIVSVELTELK